MSHQSKHLLKKSLEIAHSVARSTTTPFDEIIVRSAIAILNKVFDLGMKEL